MSGVALCRRSQYYLYYAIRSERNILKEHVRERRFNDMLPSQQVVSRGIDFRTQGKNHTILIDIHTVP